MCWHLELVCCVCVCVCASMQETEQTEGGGRRWSCLYTTLDWLEGGDKGGAVNRNELNQVALTGVGIS